MPGKRWTDEDTALVDALHAQGISDAEIAARLGRTERSVHARRHREWFQAQRHDVRPIATEFCVPTERAIEVLAQMIAHGCTLDAMAERLGGTRKGVSTFVRRHQSEIAAAIRTRSRHAKA